MSRITLSILAAAALATGCVAHGDVGYSASASYHASTPDLVYVGPGVQVIADYDEPIFYSDGFYWRYYGGTWYRSSYYTGGWVYASAPRAVISIREPYRYRRYRPAGYRSRTVVRDHRAAPVHRQPQQRQVDHRPWERREHRRDVREERRDRREERRDIRQERRDNRQDRRRVIVRDHR